MGHNECKTYNYAIYGEFQYQDRKEPLKHGAKVHNDAEDLRLSYLAVYSLFPMGN
jgi:hypothetical protein